MKRVLSILLVSLFVLVGFSGCDILGGGSNNPPTPTPVVKSTTTASPTTTSTPTVTATGTPDTAGVSLVITAYYNAIKAQNYPLAYTYLAANATDANGQTITLSSFEQMAQLMEREGGQVVSFSTAVYPTMVVMTVTRTLLLYHAHLQVQKQGQTWKITSLDRV